MVSSETLPFYLGTEETQEVICQNSRPPTEILNVDLPNINQEDATEVFIADLIACSTCFGHHYAHHQELKSIIQWLLPVVFRAVFFQVAGLVWS